MDVLGWNTETASSCDETESHNEQRYDDDKLELMGASDFVQFATLNFSQFGQVKSPFHVEFRDDLDKDRVVFLAVDGEFYKLRNVKKKIEIYVDSHMPKIKMLRFNPESII